MTERRGDRNARSGRRPGPERAGPATRAVHGAAPAPGGAMSTPIQHSSTFAFPSLEAMEAAQALGPERAFRANTRIFHVESPTNPTLCLVDLAHAASLAHRHRVLLTVDNTVASPLGQHPLAHGADLVMHSATKSIGGHGDLLAGAVLG